MGCFRANVAALPAQGTTEKGTYIYKEILPAKAMLNWASMASCPFKHPANSSHLVVAAVCNVLVPRNTTATCLGPSEPMELRQRSPKGFQGNLTASLRSSEGPCTDVPSLCCVRAVL